MPDISLQQLLSTNFSLSPSGYTGSQGAIGYTGSAGTGGSGDAAIPKITNIQVTDNTYTVLDDTAVALTGGYIKITGTGFASGCQVIIGTTTATSTTFVSATEVRAQLPATTAGTYIVYLVNADGGVAIRINGITFSATPTWITGSTLDTAASDTAISYQLSATDATTYTLQAGSSLPPGLTLSNVGLISGTVTGINNETTYSFTVVAVDAENQDSPRTFSVTITTGDQYWKYTTTLLSAGSTTPFNRDASTNNFPMTLNGDVRPYNYNPYTPGYYSNYFDGSGDYLTLGAITTSGDLTLEFWAYRTAAISSFMIPFSNGGNNGWVGWKSNATTFSWDGVLDATIPDTINTWAHYAIVKQSGVAKLYVNGVEYGSASTSSNLTFSAIGTFNLGSYNFTGYLSNVRLVNGTAVYTTAFTPPTAPLTAIANTSLLTCQSNRFIDTSTNNFTITKNGDTKVSSFTPYVPNSSYATYGSTYFDGTGDYLTIANNAALQFAADFTIEMWLYPTVFSGYKGLLGQRATESNYSPVLLEFNGASLTYQVSTTGSSWAVNLSSSALSVNAWTHIALVRSGTSVTLYVNGVSAGSGTASGALMTPVAATYIGADSASPSGAGYFTGYIADVRIVKGTAVYTSAFTPPTAPLTAIANTSLLTCQSNQPVANNTFLDNSTSNFAITRAGNTTQGTFSPYGENWSNYFDGNGDYLQTASSDAFGFGTGDYTIEAWVYPTSVRSGENLIYVTEITNGTSLGYNATQIYIGARGVGFDLQVTYTVPIGQWTHIAASRQSSTVRIFANGSLVGSGSVTRSCPTGPGAVGDYPGATNNGVNGYISNLRVIKGTAVYTANFTPNTAPLQAIAGTSLLTCQRPNFADGSANNFTITRAGDVSVQKFGPFAGTTLPTPAYSVFFDGTDSYNVTTNQNDFAFGTGDFTIEFWAYLNANGNYGFFYDSRPAASTGSSLSIYHQSPGVLVLMYNITTFLQTPSNALPTGTWLHIAISRASGSTRIFINGTQSGSTASDSNNYTNNTNRPIIGTDKDSSMFINGYLSNFRVVKGTALYTSNFTPSTVPLTNVAGTSLLVKSNVLFDSSSLNNTLSVSGDTKPVIFNPFTLTYSAKQSYTPAVFGGSMYFDGTGDYLTVNDGLHLGTADFTIELWVYNNISYVSTAQEFINGETSGSGTTWAISYSTYNGRAGFAFSYGQYGSYTVAKYVNGEWGKVKAWTHYAVQRRNGVIEIYVDGIKRALTQNDQNGTFSDGANLTSNYTTRNIANGYNGYISDFRITKGSAVYSSNFVPKNTPLQAVKNTTLLLSGTGAAIYDSSENAVFETRSPAIVSTSVVKYGNTSMYFSGASESGLYSYNNPGVRFGTGNFTVELWLYLNASLTGLERIITFANASIPANAGRFTQASDINRIQWVDGSNTSGFNIGAYIQLSLTTWTHIAICRSGTTLRYFKDGVQVASGTDTSSYNTDTLTVASNYDGSYRTNCYISDLRITKGVARYTSNFTAPASPLMSK